MKTIQTIIKALTKPPPESISKAVENWLAYNRRHTLRTQGHYQSVIQNFTDGLPKEIKNIEQITVGHLDGYVARLLDAGRCNRTANAHLTALKSFTRYLSEQYNIANIGAKIKILKEDPPQQRFLTNEQYSKVLRAVSEPIRDVIEFLANSGVRASEFCNLTFECVDWDAHRLTVIGKGRKKRIVTLNTVAQRILARLGGPESEGPIFTAERIYKERERFFAKTMQARTKQLANLHQEYSRYHRRAKNGKMDRRLLHKICTNAAIAAGIRQFGSQSLRHTFATQLLRRGVPISHVSKLLGHSSIKTTESIYIHFQAEFLDGITQVLVEGT